MYMAKTSSVFARVEPDVKKQAEMVLDKLGISMSNAINIFLRQVIQQNGLPFDVKVLENKPLAYGNLTTEQFNKEIEKGLADLASSRVVSAQSVAERMHREYDV
jgi:DNA-damage-inducible protein J